MAEQGLDGLGVNVVEVEARVEVLRLLALQHLAADALEGGRAGGDEEAATIGRELCAADKGRIVEERIDASRLHVHSHERCAVERLAVGAHVAVGEQELLAVLGDVAQPDGLFAVGQLAVDARAQVVEPYGGAVAPARHAVVGVVEAAQAVALLLALARLAIDEVVLRGRERKTLGRQAVGHYSFRSRGGVKGDEFRAAHAVAGEVEHIAAGHPRIVHETAAVQQGAARGSLGQHGAIEGAAVLLHVVIHRHVIFARRRDAHAVGVVAPEHFAHRVGALIRGVHLHKGGMLARQAEVQRVVLRSVGQRQQGEFGAARREAERLAALLLLVHVEFVVLEFAHVEVHLHKLLRLERKLQGHESLCVALVVGGQQCLSAQEFLLGGLLCPRGVLLQERLGVKLLALLVHRVGGKGSNHFHGPIHHDVLHVNGVGSQRRQ